MAPTDMMRDEFCARRDLVYDRLNAIPGISVAVMQSAEAGGSVRRPFSALPLSLFPVKLLLRSITRSPRYRARACNLKAVLGMSWALGNITWIGLV